MPSTPHDAFILHHHDPSPFAEKIRMVFGIKQLAWRSVQVPMMMPKPDLTVLTGGYRGTPVLQIGADIYCDTRLIVAEIERRCANPSLFRSGALVNFGLQQWGDEAVFPPGAALAMHEGRDTMPAELLSERSHYFTDLDFSRFSRDADHFFGQIEAHVALIERQLADRRPYLLGDAPEWADICAYFPLWMLSGHVPSADGILCNRPRVKHWRESLAAFGTGCRQEISAEAALDVARAATLPIIPTGRDVTIFPVAHPDTAVSGLLASVTDDEIVIRRSAIQTGEVAVHFPKIGYRLE